MAAGFRTRAPMHWAPGASPLCHLSPSESTRLKTLFKVVQSVIRKMAAETRTAPVSIDAIVSASKSIREYLEDVKTRDLVDHISAKEKRYFVEL